MTRKQFYRRLRKVAPEYEWRVRKDGCIRGRPKNTGFSCCPLTALPRMPADASLGAAAKVGIGLEMATDIVRAADRLPGHNPRTRAALLRAVGLAE